MNSSDNSQRERGKGREREREDHPPSFRGYSPIII